MIMEPEEAMAAIECIAQGKPQPFDTDKIVHAIHDDPRVRDAIWVGIDRGIFKVDWMRNLVDTIGSVALTIEHTEDRKTWMGQHAFGEFYFFSAWALYRGGHLESAEEAALGSLHYDAGNMPSVTLLSFINMERDKDEEFAYDHKSLPPLTLSDRGLVELPVEIEGAAFEVNVDDRWSM